MVETAILFRLDFIFVTSTRVSSALFQQTGCSLHLQARDGLSNGVTKNVEGKSD